MSTTDLEAEFSAALDAEGYGFHHIPADGAWHNFSFPDNKPGKQSGSAKLTEVDGVIKDFRKVEKKQIIFKWKPDGAAEVDLTEVQRKAKAATAEKKAKQEAARLEALNLFAELPAATADHPYLVRKGIKNPFPLKLDGDALVVPIYNAETGEFQTIQRIYPDGTKRFPKHAVKRGGCAMPGSLHLDNLKGKSVTRIIVAEGYSNADAVRSATMAATLSALDCGNIMAVVTAMRKRFPLVPIVIAADNDPAGVEAATEASIRVPDVRVAIPPEQFDDLLLAEGAKAVEAVIDKAESPAPLPVIRFLGAQIATATRATEAALMAAKAPVFVRAGMLVEPIETERPAADGRKTTTTILRRIGAAKLGYILNENIVFAAGPSTTAPPKAVVSTLLDLGDWKFPAIAGVISAPTMRPDGSILSTPGFDPATQLWLQSDLDVKLKDRPTKADALAALTLLKELISGFSLVDDLDRAVALAAIQTVVLRGAFDVSPLFLVLAHAAGTGKSFLVDLISTIVTGRSCPVITEASNEELEKRLGSILMEGAQIVSIDNCNHDLGGAMLCQMVERQFIKPRILGQSQVPECEFKGVLLGTGNNVGPTGDMTRRTLTANLDATVERPELRKFAFDPIERVLKDRGKYVAAALTIARAYIEHGERITVPPIGSYPGWSHFVREPLIWLGESDPVESMKQAVADDPIRTRDAALVDLWEKYLKEGEWTTAQIIELVSKKHEGLENHPYQELKDFLISHAGKRDGFSVDPDKLGKLLREIKGKVFDGRRIEKAASGEGHHASRWKLVRIAA